MTLIATDLARYAPHIILDEVAAVTAIKVKKARQDSDVARALEFMLVTGANPRMHARKVDHFRERPVGTIGYVVEMYRFNGRIAKEEPLVYHVGIAYEYAPLVRLCASVRLPALRS